MVGFYCVFGGVGGGHVYFGCTNPDFEFHVGL